MTRAGQVRDERLACVTKRALVADLFDRAEVLGISRVREGPRTAARFAGTGAAATASLVAVFAPALIAHPLGLAHTSISRPARYATMAQNRPMVAPGAAYYLLTAGGIVIALAIIVATLPLLGVR